MMRLFTILKNKSFPRVPAQEISVKTTTKENMSFVVKKEKSNSDQADLVSLLLTYNKPHGLLSGQLPAQEAIKILKQTATNIFPMSSFLR